jgi:hypothetical protein
MHDEERYTLKNIKLISNNFIQVECKTNIKINLLV